MNGHLAHILFYSVNLVFIVTNLYGWLLKRYFVPDAYRKNVHELFPAQRYVANFYLLQLIEVPYLLMIGRPEALFYANGTALLVFSSYILVMVRAYFFMETSFSLKKWLLLLPVWACWFTLLLPLLGIVTFTAVFHQIMTGVILAFFIFYLFKLNRVRLQLMQRIRKIDEGEYSNEDDFPVNFAKSIKWLPLILCLILVTNFLINNALVKMSRDIIFTIISVWFAIYTLNPHRKVKKLSMVLQKEEKIEEKTRKEDGEKETPTRHHLTEEQCKNLEIKMLQIVKEEKLYLEDHFTMSDLVKRMGSNKVYLSEVIAQSEYGSFYQLINTLRIEQACWMLSEDPTLKMEQVALASGFSSGSAFSQVFKRIKGVSPSEYLHK